ncbi:MAG: YbaB/EbfC family nucleoid-associated protein [Bacteriovoracaceae bacterium]|jgi:DNA-binding YbaB/EbfC family protein|nr:YbaB/EbfC family nucleoid-associated protein [Bacteriovoracaceae bacterium]
MANMNNLMKQAQQMQTKISMLQKELETREIEASSGGGMVKVKVNGKQELVEIKINKDCVDPNDVEMLEELVMTAVNQGVKESSDMVSNAMNKVTGGLNIPGLF